MKPSAALEAHRAAIRRIVEAHRARNPRVFGSVLHGDDAEGSDLDLLIDPTAETSLFDIGEASRNISKRHSDFAAAHPSLPLAVAYEMRNAVAHGYFKVDLGIVWKTVRDDLDALKRSVESALIEVRTNHGLAGAGHDE